MEADPPKADGDSSTSGAAAGESANGRGRNLRSSISFPYGSLKDAEQVASALQDHWGGSTSPDQLAASMDASARSGAFRTKTGSARIFGIVETGRGQISLTALGRRIVDPQTRADARVEAFLAVPLFSKLHEEYKGSTLPRDSGLESKIAFFGVSPKQTDKARQAFQRSAELAGFFKHGRDRLVKPPTNVPNSGQNPPGTRHEEVKNMTPPTPGSTAVMPAPLPELWLTLLRDGRSWSAEKTQEFVDTARKLHDLLVPKGSGSA